MALNNLAPSSNGQNNERTITMTKIEQQIKEAINTCAESIVKALREATVNELAKLQSEPTKPTKSHGRQPKEKSNRRPGRPKGAKNKAKVPGNSKTEN